MSDVFLSDVCQSFSIFTLPRFSTAAQTLSFVDSVAVTDINARPFPQINPPPPYQPSFFKKNSDSIDNDNDDFRPASHYLLHSLYNIHA